MDARSPERELHPSGPAAGAVTVCREADSPLPGRPSADSHQRANHDASAAPPAPPRTWPAYLGLLQDGTLRQRAALAREALAACRVCPRQCGVNRLENKTGVCGVGRLAVVASAFPHFGEEDCLRGWGGSGTIFLSGCNLRCVFCQNHDISHTVRGQPMTAEQLADVMLALQKAGCHNINWVTPSHVVPQLLEALALAAEAGLQLPIVYNTSAYDAVETLRWLDGVVDIYMPDFKFWSPAVARRLAHAEDYPEMARAALREMHRQVGDLILDEHGLARRGLLVRHLVMPHNLAGTAEVTAWLARELSPHTYLNLMDQYRPAGQVTGPEGHRRFPELGRPITAAEWRRARAEAERAGIHRFDVRQ
ncbi:radical SAM protein [Limisphaera sp. VF-2]|jgi:putative pyruvate formate lyase activating enzyme|uniref:radical SAM protein n=1 Tax=Limisphaera sp. VF-2 TaxID=3400418 RepID=UPI001771C994